MVQTNKPTVIFTQEERHAIAVLAKAKCPYTACIDCPASFRDCSGERRCFIMDARSVKKNYDEKMLNRNR